MLTFFYARLNTHAYTAMLLDPRKLLAEPGFPRETVLPLVVAYIFETRRIARQEFVAKR